MTHHIDADATQPEKQMLAYFENVEARDDKPKPVFAVFSKDTGQLVTWSLSRREMTRWIDAAIRDDRYRLAKITVA